MAWCGFCLFYFHNAKAFDLINQELILRDLSTFRKYFSQILWSFAVAEKDYAELYEKIVEEFLSVDLESIGNKDLCQYAWSFGKLGITNENIYRKIEKEILSRDPSALKYLDIQRLLTGFAHAKEGSGELFEYLEDAILNWPLMSRPSRLQKFVMYFGHLLKWDIKPGIYLMLLSKKSFVEVNCTLRKASLQDLEPVLRLLDRGHKSW